MIDVVVNYFPIFALGFSLGLVTAIFIEDQMDKK